MIQFTVHFPRIFCILCLTVSFICLLYHGCSKFCNRFILQKNPCFHQEMIRRYNFRLPVEIIQFIPPQCRVGNRTPEDIINHDSRFIQIRTDNLLCRINILIRPKIRYSRNFPAAAQVNAAADSIIFIQGPESAPAVLLIILTDDNSVGPFQDGRILGPGFLMKNQGILPFGFFIQGKQFAQTVMY